MGAEAILKFWLIPQIGGFGSKQSYAVSRSVALLLLHCSGPPQTISLAVETYLLLTAKCFRQLIASDVSIQHNEVLVVDKKIRRARPWELTFTTDAYNTHACLNVCHVSIVVDI